MSLSKKEGFWQYLLKVQLKESKVSNLEVNAHKNRFDILPTVQLKLNFSQTHHLILSYNRIVNFPKVEDLHKGTYVNDFRNLILPSTIKYSELFKQNIFAFNYFNFDLYHGSLIMLNSSFIQANQATATHKLTSSNYNNIYKQLSPKYYNWNTSLSFEQRVNQLKSKLKLSGSYSYLERYNFINTLKNEVTSNFYRFTTSLRSNFDNTIFNYEGGLTYSYREQNYALGNNSNKIHQVSPFINFNGYIKKLNIRYYIDNVYEIYKATSVNRKFYNLGLKIYYDRKDSNLKYWIEGSNMLNIDAFDKIEISADNNIFAVDIVRKLSGYIGAGVSFEF